MSSTSRSQTSIFKYYITRSDGTKVPLIPADELPPGLLFPEIPSCLNEAGTGGLLNLGCHPEIHKLKYSQTRPMTEVGPTHTDVDSIIPPSTSVVQFHSMIPKNDDSIDTGGDAALDQVGKPTTFEASVSISQDALNNISTFGVRAGKKKVRGPKTTLKSTPKNTQKETSKNSSKYPRKTGAGPVQDHARIGSITQTNVCHHWIRTGECDFSGRDQGCKYRHQMPTTLEELHAIGKRDWPAWWKRASPNYSDYCWTWVRKGQCDFTIQNPTVPCRHFHQMPRYMQEFHRAGLQEVPEWYRKLYPEFKIIKEVPRLGPDF